MKMNEPLRELMYMYLDRLEKLKKEEVEAKKNGYKEDVNVCKALKRQCRIMTAELWHKMVEVGALDEEEIEFGSIKPREVQS